MGTVLIPIEDLAAWSSMILTCRAVRLPIAGKNHGNSICNNVNSFLFWISMRRSFTRCAPLCATSPQRQRQLAQSHRQLA